MHHSLSRSAPGPRLLLYLPIHTSEFTHLDTFLECLGAHSPGSGQPPSRLPTDILVVTTGAELQSQATVVRRFSSELAAALRPHAGKVRCIDRERVRPARAPTNANCPAFGVQVYRRHVHLQEDVYDRARSDAKWVAGPNLAFYDVLGAGGRVFQSVTRHYAFVQQMEIDICPVRPGWLATLHQEVQHPFVVSGARVVAPCAYDGAAGACLPLSTTPEYIRAHLNGNALYCMGDQLQALISLAKSGFEAWPFDIALYLAAERAAMPGALRVTPHLYNLPHHLDARFVRDPRAYPAGTQLVHAPRSLRTADGVHAALVQLERGLPVTTVFSTLSHSALLQNLHYSLHRATVPNVLYIGLDAGAMDMILRLSPSRFYANDTADGAAVGSTVFKSSAHSSICNRRLLVVLEVLRRGYSVFNLDVDSFVAKNYVGYLLARSSDHLHFASDAVQSHGYHFYGEPGPRYFFNAGVYYLPRGPRSVAFLESWILAVQTSGLVDQDVLNTMFNCTTLSACTSHGASPRLLDPAVFVNGANAMKGWPVVQAQPYVVHGNWLNGFEHKSYRFQLQGMWHVPQTQCCQRTAALPGATLSDPGVSIKTYIGAVFSALDYAQRNSVDCITTPPILDANIGVQLAFDTVFDFKELAAAYSVRFFPAASHILPCAQHEELHIPEGLESTTPSLWNRSVFSEEISVLVQACSHFSSQQFHCIDDGERSLAEAALLVYTNHTEEVLGSDLLNEGMPAFLMGSWRVIDEHIRRAAPAVRTILSPGLLPRHALMSFGVGAHYARRGEDFHYEVVEELLCARASRTTRPTKPPLTVSEVLYGMLRLVPAAILAEDVLREHQLAPPSSAMFVLDTLSNNGFSNIKGSLQTLGYFAQAANSTAFMLPFYDRHLQASIRPWSTVIDAQRFHQRMPHFVPSTYLLLRHPAILVEVLDRYACAPVSPGPHDAAVLRAHANQLISRAIQSAPPKPFLTVHIAGSGAELEALLLAGHAAALAEDASLGLSEGQLRVLGEWARSGRDVAFARTFRKFNFQTSNADHVRYAAAWRQSFRLSAPIAKKASAMLRQMGPEFTCVHVRLKDEYLATQASAGDAPSQKGAALARLRRQALLLQPLGKLYIATDVDLRPWIASSLDTSATGKVFTCHDFGCSGDDPGNNVFWALVEAAVCGGAKEFLGNIFSSFSLAVCASRGDQACTDLFGNTLQDGRLLY
jgi:hypothetical protein